jgi:O-antigen ligase
MTKNYKLPNVNFFTNELNTAHYLIAFILITLPLKNIYTSVATILFVGWSLFFNKRSINSQKVNYWPIAFFLLMVFSLFWSSDFNKSLYGVQKQLSMLFIPLAFFFIPKFTREILHKIIRTYSFGMVLFGLFFLIKGCFRYIEISSTAIFFHDKLVPQDPGAVYISVFASLAIFHFIQVQSKSNIDRVCIFILALLIFLLSSKSIITIDFIIVVCYYAFFAEIPSNTKTLTILSVSLFLFLSLYFVKEVKERFLIEYETAFIDNTLNESLTKEKQNIYNVSINEAWNNKDFHHNNFFPGTALRIYQLRVFSEMVTENPLIILKGFGLEASQEYISSKAKAHNLNPVYAGHNFHNQYVQTLAELGVFGFLILIIMLFINLKNAFINKDVNAIFVRIFFLQTERNCFFYYSLLFV